MIQHRQDTETVISRPNLGSREVLAKPTLAKPRRFRWIRRALRRIDGVATPALFGTTASWGGVALYLSWTVGNAYPGLWLPTGFDVLRAWCFTLAIAVPLSLMKSRWHGWAAVLTTVIANILAYAISYGLHQFGRLPFPDPTRTEFFFIRQSIPSMAAVAVLSGVLWLPILMAVHVWRERRARNG